MVTSNAIKGCVLSRKKWRLAIRTCVLFWEMTHLGEGVWCSGESTHLPSLWPGFNSRTWCQMWIEFLFGSCLCSKGFSVGPLVFLPPQKPTFQIPIWPGNSGQKESPHGSWTAKLLLSSSSLLLSVSYLVLFVLFPATQQFIGQRLLRTRWIQLGSHLLSMPEHFAMEIMIGKYNVLWLFYSQTLIIQIYWLYGPASLGLYFKSII